MKLKLELDNKYKCVVKTDSYFKCHSQRDALAFVYMREFDHINLSCEKRRFNEIKKPNSYAVKINIV